MLFYRYFLARFRIAVENCPPNKGPTYLANLKNRHSTCLERSRVLHRQITERNNNATRLQQFSQHEKQKLIDNQRERDQQVLREIKQTPAMHVSFVLWHEVGFTGVRMNIRDKE